MYYYGVYFFLCLPVSLSLLTVLVLTETQSSANESCFTAINAGQPHS